MVWEWFFIYHPGIISAWRITYSYNFKLYGFCYVRLNNLAFWLSVFAIQIFVVAIAFEGGVSAGWTLYYPLSGADFSTSAAVSLAILSLHFLGASSEAGQSLFCNPSIKPKFKN